MADIWDNLNTTKIGDDPGTVIDTQTRNIHLEKRNRDLLSDVNLINWATFRDGGNIPGSQILTETVCGNNGSDESDRTVVFNPGPGEVWSLNLANAVRNGGSGSVVHTMYLAEKSTSKLIRWYYYQTGDSDVIFTTDNNWPGMPFIIDENFTLQYQWDGGSSITDFTFNCICNRVR